MTVIPYRKKARPPHRVKREKISMGYSFFLSFFMIDINLFHLPYGRNCSIQIFHKYII